MFNWQEIITAFRPIPSRHEISIGGRRHEVVLLPEGMKRDVTDLQDAPGFWNRKVELKTVASMAAYLNRYKGPETLAFACESARTLSAYLEYGFADAGRNKHRAFLTLELSPELKRWLDPQNGPQVLMNQIAFALHLRENAGDVAGDAAGMIELAQKFSITSSGEFTQAHVQKSGDLELIFKQDSKPTTVEVPDSFQLSVPIYRGGDERTVDAQFLYRVDRNSGVLSLGWRLTGLDNILRDEFQVAIDELEAMTDLEVLEGKFVGAGGGAAEQPD